MSLSQTKQAKHIERQRRFVNKDLCACHRGLCAGICREKYAYTEQGEVRCPSLYRLVILKVKAPKGKNKKDSSKFKTVVREHCPVQEKGV